MLAEVKLDCEAPPPQETDKNNTRIMPPAA